MNSKDAPNSGRETQTSPKNYKALLLGIVGILVGSTAVAIAATNVVQAEQTSRLVISQMMPHQGMMMHGMMAGEKTDRHFIEMMIPHHEGAVQMADLALKLSKRPEIKKLAESIKSDQTREIVQMKSWYKQWYGTEVPTVTTMNHGNMDHRGMMGMKKPILTKKPMGMQNMMAGDLNALKNAPDFDKAFIEEMIPHHKMALMMSSMIIDSDRTEMRTLSYAIVKAQSIEIEQMRQWHQTWYK
jgi:uncharacterized protein (DUF305 family)